MKTLKSTMSRGWPESRKETPSEIQVFWNYRNEVSEANGILLKQDRIIIPLKMKKEMLRKNKKHKSHIGMERCKSRARDIIFWPRMNEHIEAVGFKCGTCQEQQCSNPNVPMWQSPLPTRPWEMVATDLFQWEQINYMVVEDYYSRYVEIARLEATRSQTIVTSRDPPRSSIFS